MGPYNVLFVMADQLRRDALGCHGTWASTPHLDALAAESTVFDRAVTTSPVCIPARHSLATGLYPHNFGIWSNFPGGVAPGTPTWMNRIRAGGHDTSVFGKLHLGGGKDMLRNEKRLVSLGFDTVNEIPGPRGCGQAISHMTAAWDEAGVGDVFRDDMADRLANSPFDPRPSPLPLEYYYDVWIPDRAVEHIAAVPAGGPWFCKVSFAGPHEPWDAPEPYASMFDPEDAPLPIRGGPTSSRVTSLDHIPRWAGGFSDDKIRALRANYAGSVALIDDQVGKLVDEVKRRGEWDNTVVVVTSDHGEMNGDHDLVYKNNFHEASVQIPLIVRVPGQPGGRSSAPVEIHDLGPTVAALAGATVDHEQYGRLMPDLGLPDATPRAVAVSEFLGDYLVYDGRHKLIVDDVGESAHLWDQQEDPDELVNRVTDPARKGVVASLRDELLKLLASTQLAQKSGATHNAYQKQVDAARAHLEQSKS